MGRKTDLLPPGEPGPPDGIWVSNFDISAASIWRLAFLLGGGRGAPGPSLGGGAIAPFTGDGSGLRTSSSKDFDPGAIRGNAALLLEVGESGTSPSSSSGSAGSAPPAALGTQIPIDLVPCSRDSRVERESEQWSSTVKLVSTDAASCRALEPWHDCLLPGRVITCRCYSPPTTWRRWWAPSS